MRDLFASVSQTNRLHPALVHHIVNTLGWPALCPFQRAAIDPVLDGTHTLLIAPTAGEARGGLLPRCSHGMMTEEWPALSVVYVCPVKALLNNPALPTVLTRAVETGFSVASQNPWSGRSPMFVVSVTIHVKGEAVDRFIEAIKDNARNTRKEPGNVRFDVLQTEDDPGRFLLYEVYRDQQAFVDHQKTAHYLRWRETVADWMAQPRQGFRHHNIFPSDAEW